MMSVPLCRLEDVEDGNSAACVAEFGGRKRSFIVVRKAETAFVYLNNCPHIGAPLDFTPGQFLNLEKSMILCSSHGALFTIETGFCVSGPCEGESLTPVKLEIVDGHVNLLEQ